MWAGAMTAARTVIEDHLPGTSRLFADDLAAAVTDRLLGDFLTAAEDGSWFADLAPWVREALSGHDSVDGCVESIARRAGKADPR
jgi:hypothetical protein